jgi:hypothetical protein
MTFRTRSSWQAREARKEAKAYERKQYEGDPCARDSSHGAWRYVINAHCVRCVAIGSLNHWHAIGKDRAARRQRDSLEARAQAERAAYVTQGMRYVHKRNPADAYPWLASDDLKDAWRRGYARALGRPGRRPELTLTKDELRALVRDARRIWLLCAFVGRDNLDLI